MNRVKHKQREFFVTWYKFTFAVNVTLNLSISPFYAEDVSIFVDAL